MFMRVLLLSRMVRPLAATADVHLPLHWAIYAPIVRVIGALFLEFTFPSAV